MTAPSRLGGLHRRPAGMTDDTFLRALFAGSRPEFAALPPAVREQIVDLQFRAQRRQYLVDAPDASEQVIEDDAEPVGRCWVQTGARAHRLLDIAIDARHRGRGVGTSVLGELQAAAGRAGVPLELSVWELNHDAIRLYRRLGFRPAGGSNGYLAMRWSAEPQDV
jgi:ribosomal protein S18 acetylase RimI-like enzyme